ncbi:hypothetical protein AB0L63_25355 [Nocardia sp. NPDC051990]|uniref:hypothetical protein n=1 Tax=Nocardia sp. NPDC051990 TaxID=3155285 RepID=UPI003427F968
MKTITTSRRFLASIALVAACTAGASTIGVGLAGAEVPTATAQTIDAAQPGWQLEFTATYKATVSCYFENLDRTDATGPFTFSGTGKTKDGAVNDAKNNAQKAVPAGKKLKHCRTMSVGK